MTPSGSPAGREQETHAGGPRVERREGAVRSVQGGNSSVHEAGGGGAGTDGGPPGGGGESPWRTAQCPTCAPTGSHGPFVSARVVQSHLRRREGLRRLVAGGAHVLRSSCPHGLGARRWLASSGDSAWSGAFPGSLEAPGLLPPDFCAEEFRLPVGPHQRLTPGDAQTLGTRGCHHRVTSPCARSLRLRGPGMRPHDPHGVRDARLRGRPGPAVSSVHVEAPTVPEPSGLVVFSRFP